MTIEVKAIRQIVLPGYFKIIVLQQNVASGANPCSLHIFLAYKSAYGV